MTDKKTTQSVAELWEAIENLTSDLHSVRNENISLRQKLSSTEGWVNDLEVRIVDLENEQ